MDIPLERLTNYVKLYYNKYTKDPSQPHNLELAKHAKRTLFIEQGTIEALKEGL